MKIQHDHMPVDVGSLVYYRFSSYYFFIDFAHNALWVDEPYPISGEITKYCSPHAISVLCFEFYFNKFTVD